MSRRVIQSPGIKPTQYNDMPDPYVLERPRLLVHKHFIQLVQRIKAFNHMAKHSMPAVQVIYIISEGDEELGSATAILSLQRWSYGHGDCPFVSVLELWKDFWREVA
jgi:hypothetical protein